MNRRITSFLLCLLLSLGLCACAGQKDSAVTGLSFRDAAAAPEELLNSGAFGEDLSEAETESLLTGDAFRDYEADISLHADGTLCSVNLLQESESRKGAYMVVNSMIRLYPGVLPSGFEQTCVIHDTPVDAYRWKSNGAAYFTAAFVRPDSGVAVWVTVFCSTAEGDRREDCITRLYEITEACLNPANTLTLDSVYSGPDFLRRAETALVPVSLETEAALRAAAQQAMERYQAACAQDSVVPAQCVFDAMIVRAVSPAGDEMLADGHMAYLPEGWEFGVDDGYRFSGGIPAWYIGQTILRRGSGARAECLVGTQGFRIARGADGLWQVMDTGGPVSPGWSDCADFIWLRWTV